MALKSCSHVPHMKQTGMLVRNFELKIENLKENLTSVSLRVFCVSSRNPKRDLGGINYWRFAQNTLSKT